MFLEDFLSQKKLGIFCFISGFCIWITGRAGSPKAL